MSLEPQNPREEDAIGKKICIPMLLQGDAKQRQEHLDGQETLTNSMGSMDQHLKLFFDHTHIEMYTQIKTYKKGRRRKPAEHW